MAQRVTEEQRKERDKLARKLLAQGATYKEVRVQVEEELGVKVHGYQISQLRTELGMNSNGPQPDLPLDLEEAVKNVLNLMGQHGVDNLQLTAEGAVNLQLRKSVQLVA